MRFNKATKTRITTRKNNNNFNSKTANFGLISNFLIARPNLKILHLDLRALNNSTKVLDPVLFEDDTNLFCSDDNIRTLFYTAN